MPLGFKIKNFRFAMRTHNPVCRFISPNQSRSSGNIGYCQQQLMQAGINIMHTFIKRSNLGSHFAHGKLYSGCIFSITLQLSDFFRNPVAFTLLLFNFCQQLTPFTIQFQNTINHSGICSARFQTCADFIGTLPYSFYIKHLYYSS